MKNIRKWLIWVLLVVLPLFAGCEHPGCGTDTDDTPAPVDNSADYALPGDYPVCSYTDSLTDAQYSSARMYYPCAASGPFGATTLVTDQVKEASAWMAEHLAGHGIVVLNITPNGRGGSIYQSAHNGGIAKLRSENDRTDSPIYQSINTVYLQVLGVNFGAKGALMAAADQSSHIRSTLAINSGSTNSDVSVIQSSVALMTSMGEEAASGDVVRNLFESLPQDIEKAYIQFACEQIGWNDIDPQNPTQKELYLKAQIVYWTKFFFTDETISPKDPEGVAAWTYSDGANR